MTLAWTLGAILSAACGGTHQRAVVRLRLDVTVKQGAVPVVAVVSLRDNIGRTPEIQVCRTNLSGHCVAAVNYTYEVRRYPWSSLRRQRADFHSRIQMIVDSNGARHECALHDASPAQLSGLTPLKLFVDLQADSQCAVTEIPALP
jgi:hypothetical protein